MKRVFCVLLAALFLNIGVSAAEEQVYRILPEIVEYQENGAKISYDLKQYTNEELSPPSYFLDLTDAIADAYVGDKQLELFIEGMTKQNTCLEIRFDSERRTILQAGLYFETNPDAYRVTYLDGTEVTAGGSARSLTITVGGYAEDQLENIYYMAQDNGTAYPPISQVFDLNTIPSADQMQQMMSGLEHPYILAGREDFARIYGLWQQEETYITRWMNDLISQANSWTGIEPDGYEAFATGAAPNVREAIPVLAFVWRMTGDEAYAKACVTHLLAAAGYPDWNPGKQIIVGEMSRSVAIGYDWVYDYMNEEQRATIAAALKEKSLDAVDGTPNQNRNNWNPVTNGGVAIAALALANEYPQDAARLLNQSVRALPNALRLFYPDGGFPEASEYYTYWMDYMVSAMAAMEHALGTDFGLGEIKGIDKSCLFPMTTRGFTNSQALTFGDSSAAAIYSHVLFYLGKRYNCPEAGNYQLAGGGTSIYSVLWYDPEFFDGSTQWEENFDYCAHGTVPYATMRANGDVFAGIKGGYNQMSHGDLDLGTFTLGMMGQQWTSEVMGIDYHRPSDVDLPEYFRMSRYTYYSKQPQGHNTLVIGQPSQHPDMSFGQSLTAYSDFDAFYSGEEESYAILNLNTAYQETDDSVKHGMRVNKSTGVVELRDEIALKEKNDVWWFMHTDADIQLQGKTAILTKNGRQLRIELLSDSGEFEVMPWTALDGTPKVSVYDDTSYVGKQKLAIHLEHTDAANIHVAFYPENVSSSIQESTLDSWNRHLYTKEASVISRTAQKAIYAQADAYVNENTPASVLGGSQLMDIKRTPGKYNREGYLRFDIGEIPDLVGAQLQLYATSNYCSPYQEETLGIYTVEGDWQEDTLCFHNRPAFGEQIAEMKIPTNGTNSIVQQYLSADVTEAVSGGVIDFGIKMLGRNNANAVFAAREEGTHFPILLVEYVPSHRDIELRSDRETEAMVVCCQKGEDGRLLNVQVYETTISAGGTSVVSIQPKWDQTYVYVLDKNSLEPLFYRFLEN